MLCPRAIFRVGTAEQICQLHGAACVMRTEEILLISKAINAPISIPRPKMRTSATVWFLERFVGLAGS